MSPALSTQATTMLVDSEKNGISCMPLRSELAEASMTEEAFRTPHKKSNHAYIHERAVWHGDF